MQGEQLKHAVKLCVVDAVERPPGAGAALGCRKVFHGAKAEAGKIGDSAAEFPLAFDNAARPQAVGAVRHDGGAAQGLLDACAELAERSSVALEWAEQILFAFDDLKDLFIVAHDPAEIHCHDCLCLFGYSLLQLLIIHFRHVRDRVAVLLDIDESDRRAAVDRRAGRGGVSIGGDDDLVARADPEDAQIQLLRGRGGIKADHAVRIAGHVLLRGTIRIGPARFDVSGQTPLQQLGTRPCRDPAGAQRVRDLGDFKF